MRRVRIWLALGRCDRHHVELTSAAAPCLRSTVTAQANYEKSVFAKTSRTNARGEGELLLVAELACMHMPCCAVQYCLGTPR